jgi:hypothetical protein
MKRCLIVTLILFSCESSIKEWENGAITNFGSYEYQGIKIEVASQNNSVEYYVQNSKGDTLIRNERKFSAFQRWALHFDQNLNLWVFSSDIGDSCWRRDSLTNKYIEYEYTGLINKDSIPKEVYETLSSFHPYSNQ